MVAVTTAIGQFSGCLYNCVKDISLCIKDKREDVKVLEGRISKVNLKLDLLKSKKKTIDESLTASVSKEKTEFYEKMAAEIDVIDKNFNDLSIKYIKLTEKRPSPTTPSLRIKMLNYVKSNLLKSKFHKLANLSQEFEKLSERALDAEKNLNEDSMIKKTAKPNLQRLDEDANTLPVFDQYVNEIYHLFENEGCNYVGIHGCLGAGKTTVYKKLYNRLLSDDEEYYIIRLDNPTVSEKEEKKDMITVKLQNEIMEQLEIPHEAQNNRFTNANTISKFLCDKKYALFMDDVSTPINLEDLGVKRNHKDKKVVVCSSEKKVILSMTEHKVEIRVLNEDEAMKLIQNICGDLHEDTKKIAAEDIIKCCGGIPKLIYLVAGEVKGKGEYAWNNVKRTLQSKANSSELDLGIYAKIYEIKYEGLERDTKKCLLYGALFPLQHKIFTDHLVECWIAEGFISNERVRDNREKGQHILDKLIDDFLLQYSDRKYVMMQPIFRRVALQLDYPDEERCKNWVQSCDSKLDEAPWATVTRMSLIGCSMELPQSPKSPYICTLLLQSLEKKAKHLPEFFFAHMERLRVLDLNQTTEIIMLPGSIGNLANLKSLYLNGCLGIVSLPPEADRLEKLEFLDISGTSISRLPAVIRKMVNMRCLRASLSAKRGNHKGKQVEGFEAIIPEGIISSLKNLEELSIFTDFDFQNENGIAVAEKLAMELAMELASLENLNTLCFNFPNVSSLEKFVTHSKALNNKDTSWGTHTFRSFKIFVGRHEPPRYSQEPEFTGMLDGRWLRYSTNEGFPPRELLKLANALDIIGHDGLTSFTGSQFNLDQVKVCVVERCNHLENIVDMNREIMEEKLLPNLEKLYLYDLNKLECIWDGPVPRKSLLNLTSITVDLCPELTKILDHGLAQSLEKLAYLKVENCNKISKIIDVPGEISEDVELLKSLKRIEVSNLPELECICGNTSSIRWKSLKSIIVKRCSKLRDLSLAHTNATKLPSIHCEESWWNTLTSDDQLKRKVCFIKDESNEAGAQSRREEASTTASGSSDAITAASSMKIDYEVTRDNHITHRKVKKMMISSPFDNHQPHVDHDADRSASSSRGR